MTKEITIVLGEGGIQVGAGKSEEGTPFISFKVLKRQLKIGEKPKKEDIDETYPFTIVEIRNKESLEVLARAVEHCRKYFNEKGDKK